MNNSRAMNTTRRQFIGIGAAATLGGGCATTVYPPAPPQCQAGQKPESSAAVATQSRPRDLIDVWQAETDLTTSETYGKYMRDGNVRGLASLEKLEAAFKKVYKEALETKVDKTPAVWSVYNMGYIVKSPNALFSIDLVHRREVEFAKHLDFALVTHNHGDHCRGPLYRALNSSGKTVISNFLDNYGVRNWKINGGFTRARKTFKIKDVEIRTSLIDHNDYLIDFTTAFEIRVGDFTIYHTGDSGRGTEEKLVATWGRPDLWLLFPGCGINVEKAVEKVGAKRIVFGHLWELGHSHGRLTEPLIRKALAAARSKCSDVSVAFWGDRIC